MSSVIERYAHGQHEQAWDDLYALGSAVRRLDHFDDAMAVARETMRRVRANCELLIRRWEALGWRFGNDTRAEPLGEPLPPPVLDHIERLYGTMPLALPAFYEVVAAVDFSGRQGVHAHGL